MTESLTIHGAMIWAGKEVGFVEKDLFIVDGIVAERGDSDAQTIDGAGTWVIPGLLDAHFHAYATSLDGFETERGPLSYSAINGTRRLESALRRGFTAVRDVAGGDIGLSRAIDAQLFLSPRYLYTGPALSQTGGHGDPRSQHIDTCFAHGHTCEIVDGVENLRLAVRERFRTGAHAIKIMTSGGISSLADPLRIPQYSAEEIRAVVDEAGRRGTYVAAHAYSSEAVMHSIDNGVRSIEHGNLIDSETAQAMSRHAAFLVPTLAAYDAMNRRGADLGLNSVSLAKNSEVLSKGQEAVELALSAEVKVGFGSDLMGGLEDDQLTGIQLQVEAAGTQETLHSMTEVNAELFGDPRLGRLDHGSYGDAILLSGNPLEDPSALWEEAARDTIIQAGCIISS